MWVLLDVHASGSRQAQLRAGVLDGLGDEDVALPDSVVVRRRAARVRQLDVHDHHQRVLVESMSMRRQWTHRFRPFVMTCGASASLRFAIAVSTRPTSSSRNRSSVLYWPQRMREKLTSGTPMSALGTLKRAMSTTLSKSSPMQPATQRSLSTTTSRRSSNRSSLRSTIASLPAGRSSGEETKSSGSLRDSLEAQRTWANRLNSSTDSSGAIAPGSGAIARPRSNLEPRLPHPSSP